MEDPNNDTQPFQNAYLSGTLSRKDRAKHSFWDGWELVVKGAKLALFVDVHYDGKDPNRINALRNVFSQLSWDEKGVNAEEGFGASVSMAGLHLDPYAVVMSGSLSYADRGQLGAWGTKLTLAVYPYPPLPESKREAVWASLCKNFPNNPEFRQPHVGPNFLSQNGIMACDAWLPDSSKDQSYRMLLFLPNGAVRAALGTAARPEEFRAAVLGIKMTRDMKSPN